jgi:hypothetical protein
MTKDQKTMLKDILTIKRPHGGTGEQALLQYICDYAGYTLGNKVEWLYGVGVQVIIGQSDCLFVAHCDTVHPVDGYQTVKSRNGIWFTPDGECLGADDGAGVWMLLQLIVHGIPGTYLFTMGEECGGKGARAYHVPASVRRAFEFDRRGKHELIVNHGCTGKYGRKLAELLGLQTSTGGVFTDITAMSGDFERVNISVGYEHAHTPGETLDTVYLSYLLHRFIRFHDRIMALKPRYKELIKHYEPEKSWWDDGRDDDWLIEYGLKTAKRVTKGGLW